MLAFICWISYLCWEEEQGLRAKAVFADRVTQPSLGVS